MGFWSALEFLTIIPSPRHDRSGSGQVEIGRSLVYFPLVGLLLGLILLGLDFVLRLILPLQVIGGILIAAMAVLTGAIHLDGFMDTCDGLGGHSPARRLEIMKDSRVGAFGVAGVVILLLIKYGALVSLAPGFRTGALVLMPVLGRWAMALGVTAYPYARAEGLGKAFVQQANWPRFWVATGLALVIVTIFGRWIGVVAFIGVGLVVWGAATFIKRKLNGLTGDSYGALCELTEAMTLVLFLLWQR
ncbi:MAG: adenosylcobinamide-GDP ribazoletransferase [Dehalococcoidia bacterium]|nr:adenosylcobinamide-GDP ribazoletransferase [Dehalococcoidia bacterium]